jgi:TP901 family phage tail tape measure protein
MASRELQVVITGDAAQIRRVLGDVGSDLDRMGGHADTATSRWSRVGSAVALGAGAAGAALAGVAAAAISTNAEFERQMSAVEAVSGATAAQMGSLEQKALDLGRSTVFSATESAGAMEELVKAGLSVEDVLGGAADATVNLAAAGGTDLASAATIASNAMNSFNLAGEDMVRISDVIAGAANTSAIDVDEFGMSMQQASAVANLVGLSFEDTAAAIGLLGDAGIRGSDAGTSLKTMLTRLTPQTDAQARAFEELGLMTEQGTSKFYDATGSLKGLDEIAGILQTSLQGLTDAEIQTALYDIFGSDALRAGAVLFNEGAEGVRNFNAAMLATSAADIAGTRLDNLAGSVEYFKGAVESFLIDSGSGLNAWLRELVDLGTAGVEWLDNPPDGLVEWGQATTRAIGEGAGPAIEDLVDAGGNLLDLARDLATDLRPAAEGIAGLAASGVAVSLRGTAAALEGVTGFMASHEDQVLQLVAAYAAFKGAAIAASAWTAITGAVQSLNAAYSVMYNWVSLIAATSNMSRFQVLTQLASNSMKDLAASSATAAAASAGVAVAGVMLYQSFQRATQQAKEMRREIEDDVDTTSLESISDAMWEMDAAMARSAEGMPTEFGWEAIAYGAEGMLEILTPMENDMLDNARAVGELDAGFIAMEATLGIVSAKYRELSAQLGMDEGLIERWAGQLDLDPATQSVEEMRQAISDASRVAEHSDPSFEALVSSMSVMADETSTAADELDAFKQIIDALIGTQVGFEEAQIGFAESLYELAGAQTAASDAGEAWSTNLFAADQASLQTRSSVAGLVTEATNMAAAYYEAGGGIEGATWKLAESRNQIIAAGVAAGISQADMESYLATLGLTPDNITTAIIAASDEPSIGAAERRLDQAARDRTAYINVVTNVGRGDQGVVIHGGGYANRWGGLYSFAAGGTTPAHVALGTRYKWAEPETGGEAFIPRLGDRTRSIGILGTAAGWYGKSLVDKDIAGAALGYSGARLTTGSTRGGVDYQRMAVEVGAEVARAVRNDDVPLHIDRLQLVAPDGRVLAETLDVEVLARRQRVGRRARAQ